MSIFELFLISLGLSMDAFAVSICKGLSIKKINFKKIITISLYFSSFHILMLLIGYLLGNSFEKFITEIDHWIAFILLFIIGFNMIRESFHKTEENNKTDFKTMFFLALATSIDALAIGISFAFLNVNFIISLLIIGVIVFIMSIVGVYVGNKFGCKFERKAQLFGGIVLILIGIKILFEHLRII